GGRWSAAGGGGYAGADVVPRAWAHVLSIGAQNPLPPETETPEAWRHAVERLRGQPAPSRMTDDRRAIYRPWEEGYDPASWLDRSIQATRMETFPLNGLDPTYRALVHRVSARKSFPSNDADYRPCARYCNPQFHFSRSQKPHMPPRFHQARALTLRWGSRRARVPWEDGVNM